MGSIEKKLIMPDGFEVRYYVDENLGTQTLNMDDVVVVLKGPEENKQYFLSQIGDFVMNAYIPPVPEKPKPPRDLSDFNQKLQRGLNWNPKDHKKK